MEGQLAQLTRFPSEWLWPTAIGSSIRLLAPRRPGPRGGTWPASWPAPGAAAT